VPTAQESHSARRTARDWEDDDPDLVDLEEAQQEAAIFPWQRHSPGKFYITRGPNREFRYWQTDSRGNPHHDQAAAHYGEDYDIKGEIAPSGNYWVTDPQSSLKRPPTEEERRWAYNLKPPDLDYTDRWVAHTAAGDGWGAMHAELRLPKEVRQQIRDWVDDLDWPEGAVKEDQRSYHITLLTFDEDSDEFAKWMRKEMKGKAFEFKSTGLDIFGSAVVLRLESAPWKEMVQEWGEKAYGRQLGPRRFPGGPKAHVTVGFFDDDAEPKKPRGIQDPCLAFTTGEFNVNRNNTKTAGTTWANSEFHEAATLSGSMTGHMAEWNPGNPGKGYIARPGVHAKPDTVPIVRTWDTKDMKPTHPEQAVGQTQIDFKVKADPTSFFHITPDGQVWLYGADRTLSDEDKALISDAHPNIKIFHDNHYPRKPNFERAPVIRDDGFGHAQNVLDILNRASSHRSSVERHVLEASLAKFAVYEGQLAPIAEAYNAAPMYDPNAAPAWAELAEDSRKRANQIRQRLNVSVTDHPEPYPDAHAMFDDINRGNFVVSRANSEHPLWTPEQNVNFRIVHDVLGHHVSGGDFSWEGENQACGAHFPLLSPQARRALFSECISQTAYANHYKGFGPQKVAFFDNLMAPQHRAGAKRPAAHGGYAYHHIRVHGRPNLPQLEAKGSTLQVVHSTMDQDPSFPGETGENDESKLREVVDQDATPSSKHLDELRDWLATYGKPEEEGMITPHHRTNADIIPSSRTPYSEGAHIDPPSNPYKPFDWASSEE